MSRRGWVGGAALVVVAAWFFRPAAETVATPDPEGPATGVGAAPPARSARPSAAARAEVDEAEELRALFADQASSILESEAPLLPVGDLLGSDGFASALPMDADPAAFLPAVLPHRGEEPVRFLVGTGGEIRVRSSETHGPGRTVGGAVAYDTPEGASYWASTDRGFEEWLRVDSPSSGVVATYTVEGATPRQDGEAVLLEGEDGVALLEVTAPEAWSSDGQAIPVELRAAEDRLELSVELPPGARGPILVDPLWTLVDDLGLGRRLHAASRLEDGRVLITGGIAETGAETATTEVFDPRENTWEPAAPLPVTLRSHGQLTLADGRVFVHGRNHAFLYDPDADSWTVADPSRSLVGGAGVQLPYRSVLLPNGQVLLSGQFCCTGKQAWVYDPPTDRFHPIASMLVHRMAHTLTVLPDGSVLAAGGGTTNATGLNSNKAERLVPDLSSPQPYLAATWQPLPNMAAGHMDHGAALLTEGPDAGKVLICSGLDGASVPGSYLFTAACDLFDPATLTFSVAPPVGAGRQRSGTNNGGEFLAQIETGPRRGDVVFAGGWPYTWRSDLRDADTGLWTEQCWLNAARLAHTTTALTDGSVLLSGGQMRASGAYSYPLRSAERLTFRQDDADCDGIADGFDLCADDPQNRSYNPRPPTCGAVTGRVYFDEGAACADEGEGGAGGVMIRADRGGETRYALTGPDGDYRLDLPAGQWDVSMVDRSYLDPVAACGGAAAVYAVNAAGGQGGVDFQLNPKCDGTLVVGGSGSAANAGCNGMPYATPCPGNTWNYTVTLSNQGNPWVPGGGGSTLTVNLPPGVTYQPGPLPTCATGQSTAPLPGGGTAVTFTLGTVTAGTTCVATLPVLVNSIPSGGWAMTAALNASCTGGNTLALSAGQQATSACGCDPNDKSVFPAGCDDAGTLEEPETLDYTVRFQNLGLGPAHDVSVSDVIDPDLDLESLRWGGATHLVTDFQIDPSRKMVLRFEGIELPAAMDDLLGSQGALQYSVDPAVVDLGTTYTNSADILFDQNEVVVTNEVSNVLGECPHVPPGLDPYGPSRSGLGDGSNPGQGEGQDQSPNGGSDNPNQAP